MNPKRIASTRVLVLLAMAGAVPLLAWLVLPQLSDGRSAAVLNMIGVVGLATLGRVCVHGRLPLDRDAAIAWAAAALTAPLWIPLLLVPLAELVYRNHVP